jgi:hypothetical protein
VQRASAHFLSIKEKRRLLMTNILSGESSMKKEFLLLCVLAIISLISSSAMAKVAAKERALIVISELDSSGIRELQPLYTTLEHLTQIAVHRVLGEEYAEIEMLANNDATFDNFQKSISNLAGKGHIKAIDVILSLHGLKNYLVFKNRTMSVSEMEQRFLSSATEIEKKKLRIMYNLSCWGESHNASFIRMGFVASTGSVGVNANSEVEFIPALRAWRSGLSFQNAFAASNNWLALRVADEPVKFAGRRANNILRFTDSKKIFSGNTRIKISSDPK